MIDLTKVARPIMNAESANKAVVHALVANSRDALQYYGRLPNLAEMTGDILARNLAAAEALGLGEAYRSDFWNTIRAWELTHLVKGDY